MDKTELKKVIKPLIKECVREVLMEQGLSKIISESIQSAQTQNPLATHRELQSVKKETNNIQEPQLNEARKKMLEEIGRSGYMNNRFDPFANTKPLTEAQAAGTAGPMSAIDPEDSGIDISSLMSGNNKNVWKALVGGKGK